MSMHVLTRRKRHASHRAYSPKSIVTALGKAIAAGVALPCYLIPVAALAQAEPKRLSDWMLEQPFAPNAYNLGLSWRVASEVPVQHALREELLQWLARERNASQAEAVSRDRLRNWLVTLPITGRVPVSVADSRWLQANPLRDPILLPGHSVVWPQRPTTVTVVNSDGTLCAVRHAANREARAYLDACAGKGGSNADWAWIAQPDGRVQRFGIAMWNREPQDAIAPGAWLWGPSRRSGSTETFSRQLITFLATQGPAPDPHNSPPKSDGSKPAIASQQRKSRTPGSASLGFGADAGKTTPAPLASRSDGETLLPGYTVSQVMEGPAPRLPEKSRGISFSASDWGNVGLLQTPTARMQDKGHFSLTLSRTQPYTRLNIFFQPFDWLEAGFRYVDISNRLYDPTGALLTSQSYKDKSFDFKARLWPESAYLPQVSIGVRDAAGTGTFSGEYLVASKRTNMFDWSLGLGWGYLAAKTRNAATVGQGGLPSYQNFFRGGARPFGGVQYQTPWEKMVLKLEYDSNTYQNEPQANNQKRGSPWNVGLVYRAGKNADFTLGVERGNTLVFGLSLHAQLDGMSTPKPLDPPRVPVAENRPTSATRDWTDTARSIQTQSGWRVGEIAGAPGELHLKFDDTGSPYWRERVDKVTAVLHRDAPADIDRFVLTYRERGNDIAEHVVDRDAWVKEKTQTLPPSDRQIPVVARAPLSRETSSVLHRDPRKKYDGDYRFGYSQSIGGPDGFILYQVYAESTGRVWVRDDTWVQGSLLLRLIDNYGKFKYTAPSNLPRVRTYMREYLTTSRVTMPNLQITHIGKIDDNNYYSVYGGFLESMYGGIGGEWLYRPFASRLALGVDLNYVKQRDFHQNLSFRDAGSQSGYRVATGHATAYWDTGWNDVLVTASAGQYLAKDKGVTVQVARTFRNGVTAGAFATKTNVSSEQFGEGSFDKGLYLSIPFDAFSPRSTAATGNFVWRPLTRDGGAMLNRSVGLYGITRARSNRTLETKSAPLPNDFVIPADRREPWEAPAPSASQTSAMPQKPVPAKLDPGSSAEFRIIESLYREGFRNITAQLDGSSRLNISFTHEQRPSISQAVGQAARIVLPMAPSGTRELRITYVARTEPVATYEFFDLDRLQRYFAGAIGTKDLAKYVAVDYTNPGARESDPLARLNEADGSKPNVLATFNPELISLKRVGNDVANASKLALDVNWVQAGMIGASVLVASSALDKRADKFAQDHQNNKWITNTTRVGNALPWIGLAGAGIAAFGSTDPRQSRTGFAAAEAGVSALALATGLKYAVGRARPEDNLGTHQFNAFARNNSNSSFPSRHSAVAWAVATPFAQEYDAKWLYGVAALTNLARVGGRDHWVSDTVGGSLLGFGLGYLFWESSRSRGKNEPRVFVGPNSIHLAWQTD